MGSLRLLLAISVVCVHVGGLPLVGTLVGGVAAVEAFFVLSGFYMALVLHERYSEVGDFYRSRFARIFSGYWVTLAFVMAIGALNGRNLFSAIAATDWDFASKALMFCANLMLVGSDTMLFSYPGSHGLTFTPHFGHEPIMLYLFHYIPQAWSIPVELWFYAMAPFIVRSLPRIVCLGVLGLAVRWWTYDAFGSVDPWTYRFFPSELTFFMLGAASYHLYRLIGPSFGIRIAGHVLLAATVCFMLVHGPIVGTAWAFCVFLALSIPFMFSATSSSPIDRFMGDLSYLVYLNHIAVFYLLAPWSRNPMLAVAGSIMCAYLLQRLATPLERWLRRRPGSLVENAG